MAERRHSGAGALICIPTYNELENLPRVVPAVLAAVPEAQVLIVDDNSPDGTGQLADELAGKDPRINVMHRKGKEGLGKAYLAAFQWALARDYEFVFEFDADLSHDPRYLPGSSAPSQRGPTSIVGSRRIKGGGVENWGPGRPVHLMGRQPLLTDGPGCPHPRSDRRVQRLSPPDVARAGPRRRHELGVLLSDPTLKYRALRRGSTSIGAPSCSRIARSGSPR